MSADLRFTHALDRSTDLRFGASDPPATAHLVITFAAPLPAVASGELRQVIDISLAAPLAFAASAEVRYDNAVFTGIAAGIDNPWQDGTRADAAARSVMQRAVTIPVYAAAAWQAGLRATTGVPSVSQSMISLGCASASRWSNTDRASGAGASRFRDLRAAPVFRRGEWQEAARSGGQRHTGWQERIRAPRPARVSPWQDGQALPRWQGAPFGQALALAFRRRGKWQEAVAPSPGRWAGQIPVVPPIPPCYTPPHGVAVALRFRDPLTHSGSLRFLCRRTAGGTQAVPILRTYIVVNTISLHRVANNVSLPALALSLSIDADTWAWGWRASLPASSLDAVLPEAGAPVELEATINGVSWRLLAEKVQRDRHFGEARITVSGRGIAARLGSPTASAISRHNDSEMTAQQLAVAALTNNGVGIGWTLDWQMADWLVPAGIWSHSGTHIDAVTRIAEAAGGYVQADRSNPTLHVLPRYPVAPWAWGSVTPAFVLPAAATVKEAVEWVDKPNYNAVFVSGESAGIIGQVRRAGSAGDLVAPMVTDALITHADAARGRGIAILGDTGRSQRMSLETPIFEAVGIYPVGSFVRFDDGAESRLGLVRAIAINAGLPVVRQIIEVECHA